METKMYAIAEVKSVETENPNGEFEVILSAPTLDRDGEIIDSKVFEPLPPHITFDIDHGMSTATTVGSGVPFYDGGLLKVKGSFSSIPRAQEVRTLVAEGHIRSTSVAFMGAEREDAKDGATHIVRAELLNGAFVPIPSNREALILSAKAYAAKQAAPPEILCAACGEKAAPPEISTAKAPADEAGADEAPADLLAQKNVVEAARLRGRAALLAIR